MLLKTIRKFKDVGITGSFTRWYDKNTRENRMAEMREYVREAVSFLSDGARVLEIAPGPGYFSIELAKSGNYTVTGMDISADFVKICRANAQREKARVEFVEGNVSAMPFADNSFDFIFCSAAFKNFKDPAQALREMCRVLAPGGVVLIIDMKRDISKKALEDEAVKISGNKMERIFLKFMFKNLAQSAYTRKEIEQLIPAASFERFEIKEAGLGLYIYLYQNK